MITSHSTDYLKRQQTRFTARFAKKVLRRLTSYYQKWFRRRNHIFVHYGPFKPVLLTNYEYKQYKNVEALPDQVRETIEYYGGQRTLAIDCREIEQNGTMWAAFLDKQLTGILFTRRGINFYRWFVKLQKDDIVIFRVRTYPEFRGRGIAPSLMNYAMKNSLSPGDNAYIDCRVYNKPSIRSIEKAGFTKIATMKPISRKEAVK